MGVGRADSSAKILDPSEQAGGWPQKRVVSKTGARLGGTRQIMVRGPHFDLRKWGAISPNFKEREMKDGKTGKGERSPATIGVWRITIP